jgi:hypothetical protein
MYIYVNIYNNMYKYIHIFIYIYQGDRQSGVSYQILNFQPDVYASSAKDSSNALVPVGLWTPENNIKYSSSTPIIYNTANGQPPSDKPPLIMLKMIQVYRLERI